LRNELEEVKAWSFLARSVEGPTGDTDVSEASDLSGMCSADVRLEALDGTFAKYFFPSFEPLNCAWGFLM
jgi:hypothetical protein